jgi:hypothetical protein
LKVDAIEKQNKKKIQELGLNRKTTVYQDTYRVGMLPKIAAS